MAQQRVLALGGPLWRFFVTILVVMVSSCGTMALSPSHPSDHLREESPASGHKMANLQPRFEAGAHVKLQQENSAHLDVNKRSHLRRESNIMAVHAIGAAGQGRHESAGSQCSKGLTVLLLLHLFLGFTGASRFYLGYTALGFVKLSSFFIPCCVIMPAVFCLKRAGSKKNKNKSGKRMCLYISLNVLLVLFLLAMFVWEVVDLVLILSNKLPPLGETGCTYV